MSLIKRIESYTKTDVRYLISGGTWLTINQTFFTLAGIVLLVIVTNILPKETYGTYRLILSYIGILSIFSLQGISTAVSQALSRNNDGALFSGLLIKLRWGLLTGIVAGGISVYYFFNDNQTLALSFAAMALLLPFMEAFQLYHSIFLSKKLFKRYAKLEILAKTVSVIVMALVVFFTQDVFLIIFVYLLHLTLLRIASFAFGYFSVGLNRNQDSDISSFGKHLSFIEGIKTVAFHFDKLLIFHYLGATPLAIYAIAIAPVDQIRSILNNVRALAFPKLSNRSLEEIQQTLGAKLKKFTFFVIPIIVIYVILAPWIFDLFFPQYSDSVMYSQVYALVLLFMPRGLFSVVFATHKRIKELYYIRIISPVIRISLLWVLLMMYGLWGLVVAMVLSELVMTFLYSYFFKRLK